QSDCAREQRQARIADIDPHRTALPHNQRQNRGNKQDGAPERHIPGRKIDAPDDDPRGAEHGCGTDGEQDAERRGTLLTIRRYHVHLVITERTCPQPSIPSICRRFVRASPGGEPICKPLPSCCTLPSPICRRMPASAFAFPWRIAAATSYSGCSTGRPSRMTGAP